MSNEDNDDFGDVNGENGSENEGENGDSGGDEIENLAEQFSKLTGSQRARLAEKVRLKAIRAQLDQQETRMESVSEAMEELQNADTRDERRDAQEKLYMAAMGMDTDDEFAMDFGASAVAGTLIPLAIQYGPSAIDAVIKHGPGWVESVGDWLGFGMGGYGMMAPASTPTIGPGFGPGSMTQPNPYGMLSWQDIAGTVADVATPFIPSQYRPLVQAGRGLFGFNYPSDPYGMLSWQDVAGTVADVATPFIPREYQPWVNAGRDLLGFNYPSDPYGMLSWQDVAGTVADVATPFIPSQYRPLVQAGRGLFGFNYPSDPYGMLSWQDVAGTVADVATPFIPREYQPWVNAGRGLLGFNYPSSYGHGPVRY